ncbi:MAG TPA: hypothetical protein VKI01_08600 [Acidimicrobiia bacterium]|nr:hypothetical protein [Acidimicrobiia bacterium]
MNCRNCGKPVDPNRAELGYDYCTRPECVERCLDRVELAAVAVNKASDQYVRADEVVPDTPSARWGIDPEPEDDDRPRGRRPRAAPRSGRRSSTTKKLERAAARLDAELARLYERFCNAELTRAEMRSQQNERIRAFNALVRSENIRYRSFLRKPV